MDRNQLKVAALRQRITEIVSEYEDKITELRIDATIKVTELQEENNRLRKELEDVLDKATEQD